MIWIAAFLALFAVPAVFSIKPAAMPVKAIAYYFMLALAGQLFALPLLILALVLAAIAEGAAAWAFAAVAALAGLAHWRNRRAGRVLLEAVGQRGVRIPLLAGLAPTRLGSSQVRRIRNVAYAEGEVRNQVDLVLPLSPPPTPMPVLIHIHGGAWVMGSRDQQGKPLINHLASRGWMCVDATYRVGPKDRCPAMIVDVLKAIAWVKAHAHEHGGDPTRIAITGGSAGGHLTALAALAHDDPSFKPGFEDADCRVAMALPMYGRYDFLDRENFLKTNHKAIVDDFMATKVMPGLPDTCRALWHAMSPLDRVRADAPPMLVVHGNGDTLLPYEDARDFARALKAVSASPVAYVELPGIQHAYDMGSSALTWAHVRAVEAFLAPIAQPGAVAARADRGSPHERVLVAAG